MQPPIGVFNLFLDVVQFVSSNVHSKSELPYLIVLLNQIKRFVFLFFPLSELRVVADKKKGRPGSAPTGSRVKSQFQRGFRSSSLSAACAALASNSFEWELAEEGA